MSKVCTKCGLEKELTEFPIRSDNNKYRNECKKCCNKYNKAYYDKYPWKLIMRGIRQRCENPNFKQYKDYGGRGIKCLITVEEIKQLWFRDKAYNMVKPSIDREDNDGNYELSNCQFIELEENSVKDKRKTILQFDLNGKFIREWISARESERVLKIAHQNISSCCNDKYKTAGGFIWRFKNND